MTAADDDIGKTVGDYVLLHVLGRGQTSRVQLAINQSTQERVAVKILSKENISPSTIQKEIILHKQITKAYQQQFGSLKKSHVHLVQLLDFFQDSSHYYCILEWAGGGELFDLIEPDLGLEEDLAHFYFWQCLNSLSFLHDLGIAHRDMKPENLLLDTAGNLYISDFGLSTLFQHQGTVRFLTTPCGSPVYVAPEVLTGSYHGPAVDVWSCGIILFAMLVGNTLWEKPSLDSAEFVAFRSKKCLLEYPWNRLPSNVKELLLGMLEVDWKRRLTIDDIRNTPWFTRKNPIFELGIEKYLLERENRRKAGPPLSQDNDVVFALSQPMEISSRQSTGPTCANTMSGPPAPFNFGANLSIVDHDIISFSQPVFEKAKPTQAATFSYALDHIDNLKTYATERLTRFFTRKPAEFIMRHVCKLLDAFLIPYQFCEKSSKIIFSTVDKRKCLLKGSIYIRSLNNGTRATMDNIEASPDQPLYLVVFQKVKGDPMEFKRFYKIIFTDLMESKAIDTANSFSFLPSESFF